MLTFYEVLRAVIGGNAALLNDAKWVEHALRAIAAHEHKYPAPAVPAEVKPAATEVPDTRDAEIASLRAQLAAADAAAEGSPG